MSDSVLPDPNHIVQDRLTPGGLDAWRAFRKVGDQLSLLISRDLTAATGLSGVEYGVLGYLSEHGPLRQSELGEAVGWHKSRLSHLLTRMQERGLIERRPAGNKGVIVNATEQGQALQRQGRPLHEDAVLKHFASKLTPAQLQLILELARQLNLDGAEEQAP